MTPERIAAMEAAKQRLSGALEAEVLRHDLTRQEILALLSWMVGLAIANQDKAKICPITAMQIVMANIQIGNSAAVAYLQSRGGEPLQ